MRRTIIWKYVVTYSDGTIRTFTTRADLKTGRFTTPSVQTQACRYGIPVTIKRIEK